jgi:hypothetical protein
LPGPVTALMLSRGGYHANERRPAPLLRGFLCCPRGPGSAGVVGVRFLPRGILLGMCEDLVWASGAVFSLGSLSLVFQPGSLLLSRPGGVPTLAFSLCFFPPPLPLLSMCPSRLSSPCVVLDFPSIFPAPVRSSLVPRCGYTTQPYYGHRVSLA